MGIKFHMLKFCNDFYLPLLISGFFNNCEKRKIKRPAKLYCKAPIRYQMRYSFGLKKEMPMSFLYLNPCSHHMLFLFQNFTFLEFFASFISVGDKKTCYRMYLPWPADTREVVWHKKR